jgi:hypothetical protein
MISLAYALPELQLAERALRAKASAIRIYYSFADLGQIRTQTDTTNALRYRDQDYAVYVASLGGRAPVPKETWRPIAQFGSSYHNYGAAFDVTIDTAPAGMSKDAALAALGALAPSVGLRWGGTFPSERRDPPHFELAITLDEAHRRWAKAGNLPGQLGGAGDPVSSNDASTGESGQLIPPGGSNVVALLLAAGILTGVLVIPRLLGAARR